MSSSIKAIAKEIGADNYIICGNGAIIYDLKKEKILSNSSIPKAKVLELIKICDENNIYYTLNTEKYILSKKLNYNLKYYYYENSKKQETRTTNINIVEDTLKYIEENDIGKVNKMTVSDENIHIFSGIMKKLKKIEGINVLDVTNMSKKIILSGTQKEELNYFYTEITNENVNKWEALKKLSEYLKIKKEEIVAIGDNINDLCMIENAGLGIIIGGSSLAEKNLNKIIVKDNNSARSCRSYRKIHIKIKCYKNITNKQQICYKMQKILYILSTYCIIK